MPRAMIAIFMCLCLLPEFCAQVYIRNSSQMDKYRTLNYVIKLLNENHIDKKKNIEIIASLLSAVKQKAGLPIQYSLTKKTLTVNYKRQDFKIRNAYRVKFTELCDLMRPELEAWLKEIGLGRPYQALLTDLLLSQSDGSLFLPEYIKHYSGNESSHLDLVTDKQHRHLLAKTLPAADNKTIEAGSELIEISGYPIRFFTTSMLADYIFYRRDSIVDLKIVSNADTVIRKYKNSLVRPVPKVTTELRHDSILYVRILSFEENTGDSVKYALRRDSSRVKQVVLDIRECTGGLLAEAYKTIDLFVKDSLVISTVKMRTRATTRSTSGRPLFRSSSIAVITDSLTAGAAEVLTFALSHYCGADVIGQKTFGGGTLRKTYRLKRSKYIFHFPVAHLTVAGRFTMGRDRVTPDKYLNRLASFDDIVASLR